MLYVSYRVEVVSLTMADLTTRHRRLVAVIFVIVCVLLGVGLLIGLVIRFTVYSDPEPVKRTAAVGNCIPEAGATVDSDTCFLRG